MTEHAAREQSDGVANHLLRQASTVARKKQVEIEGLMYDELVYGWNSLR